MPRRPVLTGRPIDGASLLRRLGAQLRDLATGTTTVELPAHPDIVYSARFSPDGRLLATACRDRTVRVWDWRARRLVCPPFEHQMEAVAAVFTPDGRWVLSASAYDSVRVWDWRSGKPVTPPLSIGIPMSLAVTPAGTHAVVGGFSDTLGVFDLRTLAPTDTDPELLRLRAELLAGQQLHEGGGTANLSADEWFDRWQAFRRQSPTPGIAEPHVSVGAVSNGESRGCAARGFCSSHR